MTTLIAIGLALIAAVALAYGALFQHRGVAEDTASAGGLSPRTLLALLRNRAWLLGMLVMGIGIVANVAALAMAPVMVVQPIGAVSLIVSVILGSRHRGLHVGKRMTTAIITCAAGVCGFVVLASQVASTEFTTAAQVHPIGWLSFGLALVFGVLGLAWRKPPQLVYIVGAGLLYACVATNIHVLSVQFLDGGLAAVSWLNAAGLAAAAVVGSVFVQAAYSAGPPEMVIAGLTVIDPIFAVVLGSVILGEAASAPGWTIAAMIVLGLVACVGVLILSRYHPEVEARAEERRRASRERVD